MGSLSNSWCLQLHARKASTLWQHIQRGLVQSDLTRLKFLRFFVHFLGVSWPWDHQMVHDLRRVADHQKCRLPVIPSTHHRRLGDSSPAHRAGSEPEKRSSYRLPHDVISEKCVICEFFKKWEVIGLEAVWRIVWRIACSFDIFQAQKQAACPRSRAIRASR